MAERAIGLPQPPRCDARAFVPSARSLVAAAAILVAGALVYLAARTTSMFAVTRIEIAGAPPTVAAQARAALRFAEGRSLLRLDGQGVVAALERVPSIYRAGYDRDFPHTLRISLVPERPVAVLRRGAESWVVSARGRVVAPLGRGQLPSLPRIWLSPTTVVRVGEILHDRAGSLASRTLAAFRGGGLAGRIAFVKADGGRIVAGLRGGLEIRLGLPVELELKLAVVRTILPTLAAPRAGGPRYLDVAVPERPVAGADPQVKVEVEGCCR